MQYFFADGDVQKGPFPIESLRAQGIKPDSLVWREGMGEWQRADSLAELASVIGGASIEPAPPMRRSGRHRRRCVSVLPGGACLSSISLGQRIRR